MVGLIMSGGRGGQLDDGIIAQAGHGFQSQVAAALDDLAAVSWR